MRFLSLFCLLGLLASCGPAYLYEAERPLPDATWTYADSLSFDFDIADTTAVYDLYLDVTHRPDYAYQNLYTRILTAFPNGQRLDQTLSLELADKTGRWNGDCGGTRCTVRIPLQERAYFPLPGTYALTVHQYMRKEALPGIEAVGLAVARTALER